MMHPSTETGIAMSTSPSRADAKTLLIVGLGVAAIAFWAGQTNGKTKAYSDASGIIMDHCTYPLGTEYVACDKGIKAWAATH